MDMMVCGVGLDAYTASLFPGDGLAGADKAGAMAHVFDDRTPVLQAPAKLLFETSGSLHWYLDEAASPR